MDQVDLPQIGLARITRHPRAVLNCLAEMRVAFHPQPSEESDAFPIRLGKGVRWAEAHSYHGSRHRFVFLPQCTAIKRCPVSDYGSQRLASLPPLARLALQLIEAANRFQWGQLVHRKRLQLLDDRVWLGGEEC